MKIDNFLKILPKLSFLLTFLVFSIFASEQENFVNQQNHRLNLSILRDSLTEVIKENEELSRLRQNLEELNAEIDGLKADLNGIKEINKGFIEKNNELKKDLNEVDELIKFILDPTTTPTALAYLRAVHTKEPKNILSELYNTAINPLKISNIITGGHTKFKNDAPEAHVNALKMCGLRENLRVTESYSTIEYSSLNIKSSPKKELESAANAVQKSDKR